MAISALERLRKASSSVSVPGAKTDPVRPNAVATAVESSDAFRDDFLDISEPTVSTLAPAAPAAPAAPVAAPASRTAEGVLTPQERLRVRSDLESSSSHVRKEMAAMRTLTRLLEAVFTRPGSAASDEERMDALTDLSTRAYDLGTIVARVAGDDANRSRYVRALAMEAAVSLVTKSWEQDREIDWEKLISAAAQVPEVDRAAEALALAVYQPVQSAADASDRFAVSMHSAFWQVYSLGSNIDGVTPKLAAGVVRDCVSYLQGRDKFVLDNDLYVSWMQGSLRRMTDLVCAEMKARFRDVPVSEDEIEAVLAVSRSGFEGVENYAQIILEKPSANPVPRPADS